MVDAHQVPLAALKRELPYLGEQVLGVDAHQVPLAALKLNNFSRITPWS